MKTIGMIVLAVLGITAVASAAVLLACTVGLGQIAKEEDQQIQRQIEDDRETCGLIEED